MAVIFLSNFQCCKLLIAVFLQITHNVGDHRLWLLCKEIKKISKYDRNRQKIKLYPFKITTSIDFNIFFTHYTRIFDICSCVKMWNGACVKGRNSPFLFEPLLVLKESLCQWHKLHLKCANAVVAAGLNISNSALTSWHSRLIVKRKRLMTFLIFVGQNDSVDRRLKTQFDIVLFNAMFIRTSECISRLT